MSSETEPETSPYAIALALLQGNLRPADRQPEEISGYYFDFFVHPEYPSGAGVVIQWIFQDGKVITAAPIHAYEWAEHSMKTVGRDLDMLPDVSKLLCDALKLAHSERIGPVGTGFLFE